MGEQSAGKPHGAASVAKSRDREARESYLRSVGMVEAQQKQIRDQRTSMVQAAARLAAGKSLAKPSNLQHMPQSPPISPHVTIKPQLDERSGHKLTALSSIGESTDSKVPKRPEAIPRRESVDSIAQSAAVGALAHAAAEASPSLQRPGSVAAARDSASHSRRGSVSHIVDREGPSRSRTGSQATVIGPLSGDNSVDAALAAVNAAASRTSDAQDNLQQSNSARIAAATSTVSASDSGAMSPSPHSHKENLRQNGVPPLQVTNIASNPSYGLSSGPQAGFPNSRSSVVPPIHVAAAAKASKLRHADVPARSSSQLKLITSLSAALKRDQEPKKESDGDGARNSHTKERNVLIEQAAARLSAMKNLERSASSSSPLLPRASEDPRAQSALAAALQARPNAESRVAEINSAVTTRQYRHSKRYKPAALWSGDFRPSERPGLVGSGASSDYFRAFSSSSSGLPTPKTTEASTRPLVTRLETSMSKASASTQTSLSTAWSDSKATNVGDSAVATNGRVQSPHSPRHTLKGLFKTFHRSMKPAAEFLPKKVDHAANHLQQAHQHVSAAGKHIQQLQQQQPRSVQPRGTMRKVGKNKFNEERPWKNHLDAKFLSERERKRYERLWAANKGAHLKYMVSDIMYAQELLELAQDAGSQPVLSLSSRSPRLGYFDSTSRTSMLPPEAPPIPPVPSILETDSLGSRLPSPPLVTSRPVTPKLPESIISAGSPFSLGTGPAYLHPNGSQASVDSRHSRQQSFDEKSLRTTMSVHSTESIEQQLQESMNDVHGYIVAKLWRRSMLGDEILRQIWELVDNNKDGTLDRESFIVGMWLVDQCLYGRKLPPKIDEVLWSSVGRLHLKVRVRHKKNRRSLPIKVVNGSVAAGKAASKATGLTAVRKVVAASTGS